MPEDRVGREISVGDFVASYNDLYEVLAVGHRNVRIILANPSKTTRPKTIVSRECFFIGTAEDMVVWKLSGKYQ